MKVHSKGLAACSSDLEGEEAIFDFGERVEVVGSEDLSSNDREIDFDLAEPTRVDGSVDQDDGGPSGAQALAGLLTAMGGAIVGDPKTRRAERYGSWDMTCSTRRSKGLMPVVFSQRPKTLRHGRPRRRRGPGAAALVFVLDASAAAGVAGSEGCLGGVPGCWFSRRPRHEVTAAQGRAFNGLRRGRAHGRPWRRTVDRGENPASVSPGTNRVAAEPAPECGAADLSHVPSATPPAGSRRENRDRGSPSRCGSSQASALTSTTTLGGKAAGALPRNSSSSPGKPSS